MRTAFQFARAAALAACVLVARNAQGAPDAQSPAASPTVTTVHAKEAGNNVSGRSSVASATTVAAAAAAGSITYQYDSFGRLKQVTVVPK